MPTANDYIKRALKLINVLAVGETPDAEDSNDSFTVLNAMLGLWNTEKLLVYQFQDETHTLVVGTLSYSIGPSATIDTVRPVRIEGGYTVSSDNYTVGLDIINKDDYDGIRVKTTGGIPRKLFYDPGFTTGTIYLYPSPSEARTLHIKTWKPFTQFATLTTNISLPPGFDQLLVYNLAVLLAAEFNVPLRQDVLQIALDTKSKIETVNNYYQKRKTRFDSTFSNRRSRAGYYYT